MKAHIQFIKSDGSEILGSDGILPLDGRLSLASAVDNAHVQAWRLRRTRNDIAGFVVYRCGIRGRSPVNGPSYFHGGIPDGSRAFH